MIWRNDKPKDIGEYVILVPAFESPQNPEIDYRPSCTCSAQKAWFDGKVFVYKDVWEYRIEPERCLWTPMPYVFMDGWTENGIKIGWRE